MMNKLPGEFDRLRQLEINSDWAHCIENDVYSQFPEHPMFSERDGPGFVLVIYHLFLCLFSFNDSIIVFYMCSQNDLRALLRAYCALNPTTGYCQAQAPVACFLLMHLPLEKAFWCFTAVCERYLIGYYDTGLSRLLIDGDILFRMRVSRFLLSNRSTVVIVIYIYTRFI